MRKSDIILLCAILCGALLVLGICGALMLGKGNEVVVRVGGEEYASATLTLQASEKAYDAALLAFETVGEQMNASLESLIAALRTAEDKLKELETTLFDKNVEEELKAHAKETEAKLNQLKDSFFESFEAAHAEDLAKIEQALLQKKQQLKDEIGK